MKQPSSPPPTTAAHTWQAFHPTFSIPQVHTHHAPTQPPPPPPLPLPRPEAYASAARPHFHPRLLSALPLPVLPPPPTLNRHDLATPPPPPSKPTLAASIPSQRTKSAKASRNSLIVSSVRSREPRGIVATAIGVGTHQGSSPSRLAAASRSAPSKQAHADGACCTYPPQSHHAAWPAPRAHATASVEGTHTAVTLQPTRCRGPRRSKYTQREGAHQREPGGTERCGAAGSHVKAASRAAADSRPAVCCKGKKQRIRGGTAGR